MASTTIYTTRNVTVSSQYTSQSYTGSYLAFGRGSSNDEYRLLLQFSVSSLPANVVVDSATLTIPKVEGAIGSNAGFTATCRMNTGSWGSSVNWDTKPSNSATGAATAATGTGHSGNVVFDVTTIVQNWVGGTSQYGVVIYLASSVSATHIKTAKSLGSYLTITYHQAASTITLGSSVFTSATNHGATVTASDNSYTHVVTAKISGSNTTYYATQTPSTAAGDRKTAASLTSSGITLPSAIVNAIPNATSASGTLTLTTYSSGGTVIGSVNKSITVKVNSSVLPSVTLAVPTSTGNSVTTDFVVNLTKVLLNASNGTAGTGASIVSYTFAGGGWSKTVTTSATSATATSATISTTSTTTYSVTITDSRGRTYTASRNVSAKLYNVPKLTAYTAVRNSGTPTRLDLSATASWSDAITGNTVSVKVRTATISGTTVQSSITLINASSANPATGSTTTSSGYTYAEASTYLVTFTVTDALGGSATYTRKIYGSGRAISVSTGSGGVYPHGVAFNGLAQDNKFISNLPSYFPSGLLPTTQDANFNMDALMTPGLYDWGTNVTVTNWPYSSAGAVLVLKSGGSFLQQVAFARGADAIMIRMYDATNSVWGSWRPATSHAAATAIGVSTAQSLSTTTANIKVDNSVTIPYPSGFFTHVSTGAFQCNVNGYVMASGGIFANGLTAQDRIYVAIGLDSNGSVTAVATARNRCVYADIAVQIPPVLIQVSAGDVIRLRAANNAASRGSVVTGTATYLSVQYV